MTQSHYLHELTCKIKEPGVTEAEVAEMAKAKWESLWQSMAQSFRAMGRIRQQRAKSFLSTTQISDERLQELGWTKKVEGNMLRYVSLTTKPIATIEAEAAAASWAETAEEETQAELQISDDDEDSTGC
jgi:tRNA U34 5-methylaminomethyl-2-thiouridine-forming methyltransferase MnmC